MSLFSDTADQPAKKHIVYPVPVNELPEKDPTKSPRGRKPAHENRNVTMKHAAFLMLREAGMGPTQAAKQLGYTPETGSRLEKKLNAYEAQREKLLSLSVKTVEKFVQGKPVGQTVDPDTGKKTGGVQPKGSDVMRAVELVMDREQPKVNLNANVNVSFDPIKLDDYF